MEFIFATNNPNKVNEVKQLIKSTIKIVSLKDINFNEELEETGKTLEDNALQKAIFIFNKYNLSCFADDSGLEIEALNNQPGVLSARYAGDQKNAIDNMNKVLREMKKISNRSCSFKTTISLIVSNKSYLFTGEIKGSITKEKRGENGFGYDPIFLPLNHNKTFGEMNLAEKNKISHRAIAVNKLCEFLNTL